MMIDETTAIVLTFFAGMWMQDAIRGIAYNLIDFFTNKRGEDAKT